MQEFENSPGMLMLKDVLREFFLGIIENVKGAFIGFGEWITSIKLGMPPMLKLFGNSKLNVIVLLLFMVYIAVVNIKAYYLFKADKRYSKMEDEERIPEWRLMANIWLGGAVGSIIAMYKFRHKTKHKKFTISAKLCVFLDLLISSFIVGFLGFWAFF